MRRCVQSCGATRAQLRGVSARNQVFGHEGALAGLQEVRRRGQTRFLGISGHYRPEHFNRMLESGEFDIIMAPFNFVDRFSYAFEQEILSAAAKHNIGVVAMKTLGGAVGLKYDTREQRATLPDDEHQVATRYTLGLRGIAPRSSDAKVLAR